MAIISDVGTARPANKRATLDGLLHSLADSSVTTLDAAKAIQRQLLGAMPSPPEGADNKVADVPPMLLGIEQRLARIMERVQATNEILAVVERETKE